MRADTPGNSNAYQDRDGPVFANTHADANRHADPIANDDAHTHPNADAIGDCDGELCAVAGQSGI